jgi:hypothetical protein
MLKYQLQNVRLSASQAAITLSSIPNTYDDLYVLLSVRSTNADDNLYFRFNNTTANTSWRNLLGFSTGVSSQSGTGWLAGGGVRSGIGTSDYTNIAIYIPNYAGSTTKTAMVDSVSPENWNNAYQFLTANLWNDTAAINRIDFYMQGGSIVDGSKVAVYGIKRGSDGRTEVASGGTITTAGGYTYHTFTGSGTFSANQNLNADYLVVAGGGSGGYDRGSGGGAGGYLTLSSVIPRGSYAVTVGAGGATQNGYGQNNPGNSSSFLTLNTVGGGSGVPGSAGAGRSGGSGSGGGSGPGASAGGAGTSGQGFAGGAAGASTGGSGGGGGASAVGSNGGAGNGVGGAGGNGLTWLNGTTYAGGGGGGAAMDFSSPRSGGAGGTGGGGAGGNTNGASGAAGTANTGGGGGGGANISQGNGGAGGSGVVIIRYLSPA